MVRRTRGIHEVANEVSMRVYPAFFPLTLLHVESRFGFDNGKGLVTSRRATEPARWGASAGAKGRVQAKKINNQSYASFLLSCGQRVPAPSWGLRARRRGGVGWALGKTNQQLII